MASSIPVALAVRSEPLFIVLDRIMIHAEEIAPFVRGGFALPNLIFIVCGIVIVHANPEEQSWLNERI